MNIVIAHHHSVGVLLLLIAFLVAYAIGLASALIADRRDRS